MANPKPDLQGWADRPSEPGWQERAIARVRARQKATRRANERKNGIWTFFDDEFRYLLDEACIRRNISLTGYMRRAAAAMIAYDLGMELEEVTRHGSQPAPYAGNGGGRLSRTQDNGTGQGPWRITGAEE
jgi:hypothetical protein